MKEGGSTEGSKIYYFSSGTIGIFMRQILKYISQAQS